MLVPGGLANLGWLEQHINHRKRSSNFNGVDSEMDVVAAEAKDTTDTTITPLCNRPGETQPGGLFSPSLF